MLGAFSIPAPAQATSISWGDSISWGGATTTTVTYGSTILPPGTLIGLSYASSTKVNVWAKTPGSSTPFIVAVEDKAIWGV